MYVVYSARKYCSSGFSIRAGGQRNSPAIACELGAYFSLEITPNFTNSMRNIRTEHKLWIGKVLFMKNK